MRKIKLLLLSCFLILASTLGVAFLHYDKFSGAAEVAPITVNTATSLIETLSDESTYDDPNVSIVLDFSGIADDFISLRGQDLSEIWAAQNGHKFMGVFDGNGYEIKDLVISSQTQYFGLFGYVDGYDSERNKTGGGVIKNLKISNLSFNFAENASSDVYAGAIIGQGRGATIENCEIGQIDTESNIRTYANIANDGGDTFNISTKLTFGNVAGAMIDDSYVLNTVSYTQNSFKSNIDTKNMIVLGGVVGLIKNSTIFNSVSSAKMSFEFEDGKTNTNLDLQMGGIVGQAQGSSSQIYNATYSGDITVAEERLFPALKGAIVGKVTTENKDSTNINFCYWLNADLRAFGEALNFAGISSNYVKKVDDFNLSFYQNSQNWDDFNSTYWWNFDDVWIFELQNIHLQVFKRFNISQAATLDTRGVLKSCNITVRDGHSRIIDGQSFYKYGSTLNLTIEYQDDNKGFYTLDENEGIKHDRLAVSDKYLVGDVVENLSQEQKIIGYQISVKVCAATAGNYSFNFQPIYFEGIVEVQEQNPIYGGVKLSTGERDSTSLQLRNLSKGVTSQPIQAVPKNPYDFVKWELYYVDNSAQNGWKLVEDFPTNTQKTIQFKFGDNTNLLNSYFNQDFKLVATFSDASAILFTFYGYDPNIITGIKFNNEEFIDIDHPIKVASYETGVPLQFNVKSGYIFDVDTFTYYMRRYYGNSKDKKLFNYNVKTEEDGSKTYTFPYVNVKLIKDNAGGSLNSLEILISATEEPKEEKSNLTWLWITLGVVGFVLIVVIIISWLLIRRRNIMRRLEKEGGRSTKSTKTTKTQKNKEKKIDYKDYYD